jgi:hypothetical protein
MPHTDPFINYRFHIEIEGLETLGFTKMSQLENVTEIETYLEGGVNDYIHKFPSSNIIYASILPK